MTLFSSGAEDQRLAMTKTEANSEAAIEARLKVAVLAELDWIQGLNSAHIGVAVNDGAVTLSGEVESYPEKRLAERAVLHVRGVSAVADEITVRSNYGPVNDTDLARSAAEALDSAIDVPADSIKVVVHDHVVHLTGDVRWECEREAAGRAVRYLKGVTGVYSTIGLTPAVSITGIKGAISTALARTAINEGKHITVTDDHAGTVTLEGTVHSWSERQQAQRVAWSAPGVTNVHNRLLIQN
jgi:osmotically-inducible protein OsmY